MLPLTGLPVGARARLARCDIERISARRLRELGLTPGVELRVTQNAGGPLLISVRGTRLALGRELARRIWVFPSDSGHGRKGSGSWR